MLKKIKTFILTFLFSILTLLLLTYPLESLAFSLTGLQLWFNKMIPALLPFMILSAIMIHLNLTEVFAKILSPLLTPLLHISANGIYVILTGFLCGFPMGARVIADLYERHKLSYKEASYLLAFCNNIGPVYFISFVLPTLGLQKKAPYLFAIYGLPFLYGIFLRYTLYRSLSEEKVPAIVLSAAEKPSALMRSPDTLLDTLDDAILSGLYSIAKLGGYMILFNLLNLLPQVFLPSFSVAGADIRMLCNCFLEITSGINRMGNTAPLPVLLFLPFGGLSCLAQTYSMIKETDLSLRSYVLHKLILSGITLLYYGLWRLFFPSSFLL